MLRALLLLLQIPTRKLSASFVGSRISAYLKLARPKQWTKSLFVLAPLIFSGRWVDATASLWAILASVVFILASAAVYALNDAVDADADRKHPRKQFRPVAAGRISVREAQRMAGLWAILAIVLSASIQPLLVGIITLYLITNLGYSFAWKHRPLVDVLLIAFGFLLRALGGCVAIGVQPSVWILVCTSFLALFMALAKRRHEVAKVGSGEQRPVLSHYSLPLLDQLVSSMLSTTTLSYMLYCYAVHKPAFMFTTLPVLYGLFRFLYLSHMHERGDQPEDAVLADRPLLISGVIWGIACIVLAGPPA